MLPWILCDALDEAFLRWNNESGRQGINEQSDALNAIVNNVPSRRPED